MQINLGYEGYRRIALNDLANARLLSRALEKSTYFKCISEIHKAPDGSEVPENKRGDPSSYAPGLPVVAYTFSDAFKKKYPEIQQVCIISFSLDWRATRLQVFKAWRA